MIPLPASIGDEVKVTLFAPHDGRRKFRGRIITAGDGVVKIEQDGVEIALDFNNIANARLVPDYDGLMSAGAQGA